MKAFFKKVWKWVTAHKILAIVIAAVFIFSVTFFPILGAYKTKPNEGYEKRVSQGIVPSEEQVANAYVYDRVVIVGVDGAGAGFSLTDTPNFDRIFEHGAVTYTGLSQSPTISAQNWASMLTGVTAQTHQMDNTKAASLPYWNNEYPSIFKLYSKRHKGATFFSIVDWTPINYGIIENCISGMKKVNGKTKFTGSANCELDQKIAECCAERISEYDDAITFVHFDAVDHTGHSDGYGSDAHLETIRNIDGDIGIIYNAIEQRGWQDSTLFIVVSDHGHTLTGGHGGEEDTEKYVTVAVAGKAGNIVEGTMGYATTQDIAAIAFYALGEKQPDNWECGVPSNIFSTLK